LIFQDKSLNIQLERSNLKGARWSVSLFTDKISLCGSAYRRSDIKNSSTLDNDPEGKDTKMKFFTCVVHSFIVFSQVTTNIPTLGFESHCSQKAMNTNLVLKNQLLAEELSSCKPVFGS
jgi:hypothetical protein